MRYTKQVFVLAQLAILQSCTCKDYTTAEDEQITLSTDDEIIRFVRTDLEDLQGLADLVFLTQEHYWVATADDIQVIANTDHDYKMKFLVSSKTPGRILQPGYSKGKRRLYVHGQLAHEYDLDKGEVVVDRLKELNYFDSVNKVTGNPYSWWSQDYLIPADLELDRPGYTYAGETLHVDKSGFWFDHSYIGINFPRSTPVGVRLAYEIPFAVDQTNYWIGFSAGFKAQTRECKFKIGVPAH